MSKRRVVVTGVGMVSPLGNSAEESWQNLVAGRSGARPVESFDVSEFPTRFAATVVGFDPTVYLPAKDVKRLSTFIHFALGASCQALEDAGLGAVGESQDADRSGVAVGSGIGGLPGIEANHLEYLNGGCRKISPFFVPGHIINMAAGTISLHYGLRGPNIAVVTACTTGTHNIGEAARLISYGDADVMVAGGAEAAISPLGIGGFSAARALSRRNDEPERASRPWDRDRDGFVLGEGAGVMVLESLEHAEARGARIYAELLGYGTSADAYHVTAPAEDGRGARICMMGALRDAGMTPEEVDYINAHGTSTIAGDLVECRAIRDLFGTHADRLLVSSSKSMTGHLLGAAGGVEAIFSVLAIRDGIAPPTINLDQPDEGCDLDFVPHTARAAEIRVSLSNSFGFGGTNGTLVFRQLRD